MAGRKIQLTGRKIRPTRKKIRSIGKKIKPIETNIRLIWKISRIELRVEVPVNIWHNLMHFI